MNRSLRTLCAATALSCLAATGVAGASPKTENVVAAADVGPDATELLFWQSAERLATAEAYRAYLSRYPAGFFAPLASAAIAKGNPEPSARVSEATKSLASVSAESQGKLTLFSDEPDSGAVSFRLGEEVVGPKALTVGSLGARKQLVVPAGRWTVLAAHDDIAYIPSSYATLGPVRVRLTTVTFGKFTGSRLASLLRFSFSSQKVVSTVSWSQVEGCEAGGEFKLRGYRPASSGYRSECRALAFESKPLTDESMATAEARRSLSRLGGTVRGAALVSSLTFTEAQRGYLSVVRFDWPGVWLGDDSQSARAWHAENLDSAREAFAGQLWGWFQKYRDAASDGYVNDFSDDDKGPRDFAPVSSATAAK